MLQTVVAAVYGLATLSGGCIGYLAWRTRDQPGGLPLFGTVVGACWWCGMLFLASRVEAFGVCTWSTASIPPAHRTSYDPGTRGPTDDGTGGRTPLSAVRDADVQAALQVRLPAARGRRRLQRPVHLLSASASDPLTRR